MAWSAIFVWAAWSECCPVCSRRLSTSGGARAAFLHVADIWAHRQEGAEQKPIEKLLSEGQNLLVQVVKDPIGTKGARLSTQVSIAGRLLVYLPQESHIGISQRIADEEERLHLREKLQQLLPPTITGGFIIRTMAEAATDRELLADVEYLGKLWQDIQEKAKTAAPAALLYQDLNLGMRVLRDFVNDETSRILIDSRETFQKVEAFARNSCRMSSRASHTIPASGRYSISMASRMRSKKRWHAASI
jgi:ribonuclease G